MTTVHRRFIRRSCLHLSDGTSSPCATPTRNSSRPSETHSPTCACRRRRRWSTRRALLEADLQLAEQVIADDVRIDDLRAAAEEKAFGLLALQAPVATDLRVVISAIHGAGDIERMGDLALHVAQARAGGTRAGAAG